MKRGVLAARRERAQAVNDLVDVIAARGRHFFRGDVAQDGRCRVGRMEVDDAGRCWWVDERSAARIYTHYTGRWRRFSHGGSLRHVVLCFRRYVTHGTAMPPVFGPWPDSFCGGDPWGYGAEAMAQIRTEAAQLGLTVAGAAVLPGGAQ